MDDKLGIFGHHPDPSTDFTIEVESLEGTMVEVRARLRSQWPFWARLSKLLRYVRSPEFEGLDAIAQRAKPAVLTMEGRFQVA
jgi:hypothetical protein